MSIDHNLHIGPYFVLKGRKVIKESEEVFTCSNKKCEIRKEKSLLLGSFCPNCGSKRELLKYEAKSIIYARDFEILDDEEKFVDELCYTDFMNGESNIFIPNHRAPYEK